ncbi:hypothetical protein TSA66_00360 [Noviherbaspirillum autotrophicum]|uniref:Uncharacterized protein n=1 Tax=Noviherbaspirillum autotrophicum TaxID=709839 RepID=A0A0C2BVU0_9BURK|nr:hypothetical protein TSA66_14295 [Noviherbaspirillum autotrophicum]KIF82062.1 hypothetical protein TSA66_16660 [Noviherbaspirillum autotrophicum]KIF84144.1 hypothetical protein TSA66_00360 [Noviherbaspirillum autotrophicum]
MGNNGTHCFDTHSAIVQKVCADYQINWKLWALMGEPVGNYTLSWKLTSIQFRDQRKRGDRLWFSPDSLPPELRKAAGLIELYIDGHASVNVTGAHTIDMLGFRHRFNTGTAVRPGGQHSFNVPGSPSWDDVFGHYDLCKPAEAGQWKVDAKTAQNAFKQGIYSLQDLILCPESGVSELTMLEDAVDKLCSKPGAAAKFVFCQKQEEKDKKDAAKQDKEAAGNKAQNKEKEPSAPGLGASVLDGAGRRPPESIHDLLDESTERTAIRKKLAQETASYRRTAEAACQDILRDIDACYVRAQCPRPQPPAGTSEGECNTARGGNEVPDLYLVTSDCDEKCREGIARRRKEEREKEAREWHAKWDPIRTRCEPYYEQQKHYRQCEKNVRQTCNPKNFNNLNECTNEQVRTKGPTEKDARKLMQKEWNQRSKTGSSITNSILD